MAGNMSNPISQKSVASVGAGTVTGGATSAQVVAANNARAELIVCNDHATQIAYLGLGVTAVVGSGVRIEPKTCVSLKSFTGAVNVICSGASTNIAYSEV